MSEKRRNLDWIQFGILLCAILGMILSGIYEAGRITERLDDHGVTLQEMKADVKSLDDKIDRKVQALQDRITEVEIQRNTKAISDSQRKEEPQ